MEKVPAGPHCLCLTLTLGKQLPADGSRGLDLVPPGTGAFYCCVTSDKSLNLAELPHSVRGTIKVDNVRGTFFVRCEELPGCMVFVPIREECPSLHCGTPLYRVDPVYNHCIFFTKNKELLPRPSIRKKSGLRRTTPTAQFPKEQRQDGRFASGPFALGPERAGA